MSELIMLIGIPGSGKSFWAENYVKKHSNYIIHSSDALRKELYDDEEDQTHNEELFVELHKRIRKDLLAGHSVIYDATNLSKKKRIHFFNTLPRCTKHIHKKCVLFMTGVNDCIVRNQLRDRYVPDIVIRRMHKTFCPPAYDEGFDEIVLVQNSWNNPVQVLSESENFDQENSHHSLSLLKHMRKAVKYVEDEDYNLKIAALFHDIGKLKTKTKVNYKGVEDGDAHYYNHPNVGAYEFLMCYTPTFEGNKKDIDDALYIANLIYFHMHPYVAWKQSKKTESRDRKRIGEKMYNDIIKLHEADVAAH